MAFVGSCVGTKVRGTQALGRCTGPTMHIVRVEQNMAGVRTAYKGQIMEAAPVPVADASPIAMANYSAGSSAAPSAAAKRPATAPPGSPPTPFGVFGFRPSKLPGPPKPYDPSTDF